MVKFPYRERNDMSVYVISDLHGCYEEFMAMLEKISFSGYDELYIAGDICDRGKEPIRLLRTIMEMKNAHLIFGNHDIWLARYAPDLITGKKHPSHLYFLGNDFRTWLYLNGGTVTMDQFMDQSMPVCHDMRKYLEDNRRFYQELTILGKKYLIVHAGLGSYCQAGIHISEVPEYELVWPHIGLDDNPFEDVTMIVGHYPTFLYGSRYEGKIAHGKNLIHIDCGCVYGRTLGCIRLEDGKEFYVESTYPKV